MSIKLSYSAASRFRQCPQKYYHSLHWKSTLKPSAFLFGSAVEDGITQMLITDDEEQGIQKFQAIWQHAYKDELTEYYKSDYDKALVASDDAFIQSHFEDMELKYDTWQEAWRDALDPETETTAELKTFAGVVYWWSCRKKGEVMLRSFWKKVYPEIEEVITIDDKPACQFKIELENAKGDTLIGYIDYIIKFKGREYPVITDAKTASVPYTEHDIETSDQLRTYVTAVRNRHNLDCDAGYMVLGKRLSKTKVCESCNTEYSSTKRKCDECKGVLKTIFESDCQLLFTEYSEELLEAELDDYENLISAIDNNVNFRNTGSCNAYGRKCEFYDVCWKNKKPEEIKDLEPRKERK